MQVLVIIILALIFCGIRWAIIGGLIYFIAGLFGLNIAFKIAFLIGILVDLLVMFLKGDASSA